MGSGEKAVYQHEISCTRESPGRPHTGCGPLVNTQVSLPHLSLWKWPDLTGESRTMRVQEIVSPAISDSVGITESRGENRGWISLPDSRQILWTQPT